MYNGIAKKKAMTERSNGKGFIKRDVRMVRGRYAVTREMHFISLKCEMTVALHGCRRYRLNEDSCFHCRKRVEPCISCAPELPCAVLRCFVFYCTMYIVHCTLYIVFYPCTITGNARSSKYLPSQLIVVTLRSSSEWIV